MHRFAVRTLTVAALTWSLAATSLPAHAQSARPEHRGGKKPVGEIVSFDDATSTLVVALAGGDELTATVDPDVQVKLDHRGYAKRESHHDGSPRRAAKERRHGNPTRGSVDDLLPGTPVLRLKLEDGVVTKIRLRPLPIETPALPEGENREEAPSPDDEGAESEDSDDDEPDEDDRGDLEDALPPPPVPLP